ncbi:WW domain-binding protein 4 isoform X2 [Phlebotomus argentipes]|uniref:WW domain-binding protein 4 isoform X1 n=1 Tax=Phlebotomus argentipes TaxID=94469 RepID=UPI0028936902|nr:WW domain-binding protein 4 isoform X1 [Phlebotomus argentipes]XP_059617413.1 WW domain-binding protein 4 isoform X2 [Phlebotomus argentipes]
MADYWKSNERKFCDFCKCWIADNKPSIQFHENGRRHKANVEKRISEISKKAAKDEKSKKKMDIELRKMEEAAMAAYAQDIHRNADMTSQNINRSLREAEVHPDSIASTSRTEDVPVGPQKPVDPLLPPMDPQELAFIQAQKAAAAAQKLEESGEDPTLWCEAKTPEGYTYYWNVKTNESVWEAPKEGFLSLDEYNKINDAAVKQQEQQVAKETQFHRDNADEFVAKNMRERLKHRRVKDDDDSISAKWAKQEDFQAVDTFVSPTAGPYGKWQTVAKTEEKRVDLQLPKTKFAPAYVPPVAEPPPPERVRNFKEKVISLDSATASSVPGFFKKRKIQFGVRNTRQRLNDD